MSPAPPGPPSLLELISTRWGTVTDPLRFVYRYGPAIRAYLAALVRDPHDADDVTQDFLLRMLRQAAVIPDRLRGGRFRDYLKAALRNAATDHYRRRAVRTAAAVEALPDDASTSAGSAYDLEWRQVLLDRCWEALEAQERAGGENYGYTVLRLTVDRPDADSAVLAADLASRVGRPVTAEAFRKQRSRARKAFARCLLDEVRQTLAAPTADAVAGELTDLGLLEYVRDYLPGA